MRNTWQGPLWSEGGDVPTLQQIMKTMRALQEANEEYYQEQSEPEKKPRHCKSDYEKRLELTKSAFRHALWQRLWPSEWLWRSMCMPMRSCAGLMRSCKEACTNRVGVPSKNVPQICRRGTTPRHSLSKLWTSWCHPIT